MRKLEAYIQGIYIPILFMSSPPLVLKNTCVIEKSNKLKIMK